MARMGGCVERYLIVASQLIAVLLFPVGVAQNGGRLGRGQRVRLSRESARIVRLLRLPVLLFGCGVLGGKEFVTGGFMEGSGARGRSTAPTGGPSLATEALSLGDRRSRARRPPVGGDGSDGLQTTAARRRKWALPVVTRALTRSRENVFYADKQRKCTRNLHSCR